ncbi:hypothetical protein ACFLZ9_00615 [Patescibacteria group bacterium]
MESKLEFPFMSSDFKQTVNLRQKAERERQAMLDNEKKSTEVSPEKPKKSSYANLPAQAGASEDKQEQLKKRAKKPSGLGHSKRAREIDEIYNGDQGEKQAEDFLKSISQPRARRDRTGIFKGIIAVLVLIIIGTFAYFLYFDKLGNQNANVNLEPRWYAVELVTGNIYYGEITNTAADPILIDKVYYDYDQLNKEEGEKSETSNLRLVKRGKETHGPAGVMEVVRSQVVYMEPLSEDSKVLRAILDYEN